MMWNSNLRYTDIEAALEMTIETWIHFGASTRHDYTTGDYRVYGIENLYGITLPGGTDMAQCSQDTTHYGSF